MTATMTAMMAATITKMNGCDDHDNDGHDKCDNDGCDNHKNHHHNDCHNMADNCNNNGHDNAAAWNPTPAPGPYDDTVLSFIVIYQLLHPKEPAIAGLLRCRSCGWML